MRKPKLTGNQKQFMQNRVTLQNKGAIFIIT